MIANYMIIVALLEYNKKKMYGSFCIRYSSYNLIPLEGCIAHLCTAVLQTG